MNIKVILSLCVSFLAAFMLWAVLPVNGEEQIYSDMIRLHVIASSDSGVDQTHKIYVRDAILKELEEMPSPRNKTDGEKLITDNLEKLEKAAQEALWECDPHGTVRCEMGTEHYPRREYDGFVLPEGDYTSLRVIIGEGTGHNWWCVLYPPLCKSAAEDREEVFVAAGFTEEQYKVITETENKRYRVKFKVLELLSEFFARAEEQN